MRVTTSVDEPEVLENPVGGGDLRRSRPTTSATESTVLSPSPVENSTVSRSGSSTPSESRRRNAARVTPPGRQSDSSVGWWTVAPS